MKVNIRSVQHKIAPKLRTGFVARPKQQQLRAAGGKWTSQRCDRHICYDAAMKRRFVPHVARREVSL